MTLTKKQMVREIGRRTRLKNRDVQMMLETLIEVWSTELVEGSGRIELEGLFVLEAYESAPRIYSSLFSEKKLLRQVRRISLRMSRLFRQKLNTKLAEHSAESNSAT